MKKLIYILAIFLILLVSCERATPARVVVESKESGYTEEFVAYLEITVKNTGDEPAYFVIAMVQALQDGKEIAYRERAFGDLFPGVSKTERVLFPELSLREVEYKVTMTHTVDMP